MQTYSSECLREGTKPSEGLKDGLKGVFPWGFAGRRTKHLDPALPHLRSDEAARDAKARTRCWTGRGVDFSVDRLTLADFRDKRVGTGSTLNEGSASSATLISATPLTVRSALSIRPPRASMSKKDNCSSVSSEGPKGLDIDSISFVITAL